MVLRPFNLSTGLLTSFVVCELLWQPIWGGESSRFYRTEASQQRRLDRGAEDGGHIRYIFRAAAI